MKEKTVKEKKERKKFEFQKKERKKKQRAKDRFIPQEEIKSIMSFNGSILPKIENSRNKKESQLGKFERYLLTLFFAD